MGKQIELGQRSFFFAGRVIVARNFCPHFALYPTSLFCHNCVYRSRTKKKGAEVQRELPYTGVTPLTMADSFYVA